MAKNKRTWGEELDAFAANSLGVSEEYTITYVARDFSFVYDPKEVTKLLSDQPDNDEVEDALSEACPTVQLPTNLFLVGMVPLGSYKAIISYGIVDFKGMLS